ncbi:MAG: hypothetical protein LAO76_08450 [Acidobacteriia bacterium]|nr:hypothetical protein [Terriglobia bacterium]
MPNAVNLPACLMDCYKVLYPNLDFSRVAFYSGLPTAVSLFSDPDGFTMASGAAIPDIRVFIKKYAPCSSENFLTIAHELVHVIQIQGMFGGGRIPGSWTAYYTSRLLNCQGRWSTCGNALEKEAYDFANGTVDSNCGADGVLRDYVTANFSSKAPCENCDAWPMATPIGTQTYAEALQNATDHPVKTSSSVGRVWCSLLTWPASLVAGAFSIFGFSNFGGAIGSVLGAVIGGVLGFVGGPLGVAIGALLGTLIGGAIGWTINSIVNFFGSAFSGPAEWIWFTAFDGNTWVIPDNPISKNGHTLTSAAPAMAEYNGKLYLAYKGSGSDDLWYNVFDGTSWLANDLEITQNGHSKTGDAPALAEYNGKLYLAYRGSGSDDLWYNVFDGNKWMPTDLEDYPRWALQDQRRARARRVQRQAIPCLQGLAHRRPLVQRVRRQQVVVDRS